MDEEVADFPEEQDLFSSELSPGPVQKRLALFLVLLLVVIYLLVGGPFSHVQLGQVTAFVPAYIAAMFVNEAITAILLFAQYSILRSRALLVIANGYVFSALISIPWIMTLPGLLAPTALIGGVQSTAWLFISWHGGFALFVLGYAILKDADSSKQYWRGAANVGIALSVLLTVAVVLALSFFCAEGEGQLPRVSQDPLHFNSAWPYYIGAPIVLLCTAALIVLWIRRRSMLDLWLMVVMFSYAIEIPLTYYPNPVRFSLAWYTVRVTGFISSVLVLIVLLYEITAVYERLLRAIRAQRREREARLVTGDAVAATIAHEVKQPLSAMIMRAETTFRWLDRSNPDLVKAKAELKHLAADGHRAGAVIERVRANFKKDARTRTLLDVNDLISETVALVRGDLRRNRIQVRIEPSAKLPQIKGDSIQLQQVLLNLITNAIDSMASEDGPRILGVRSECGDDGGVMISVSDTGTGVDAQDSERIFNPLFTTKSGGMGMGLAICRSIIEAHDGRLSVHSNDPKGATFQFVLHPAADFEI
jgi:signal transduction histidine kinase